MVIYNRFKILVTIIFILHLLTGCEFRPDDVPDSQINPPVVGSNPIFFSLNNTDGPIKMGWKTDFQYEITGTDNKIVSVIVYFEGQEIHHYVTDNNQSFNFSLDPATYSNGDYNLNIEITTTTGSESIADKVGSEGFLYKLDWPVYIDKTMPTRSLCKIIEVSSSRGNELSWQSFNYPNFNSYIIYRQYPFLQPSAVPIATITDPTVTNFTDTTFFEGQNCMYTLGIQTPAGLCLGEYIWVFNILTGLQAEWHPDGTVDVKWDKAKNLESFGKYYVYAGFNYTDFIEEYIIENPDQNYVTLKKAGFGSGLYIFLKFIPRGVIEIAHTALEYTKIVLQPSPMLPRHWTSYNVNGQDYILLASFSKIFRYYPHDLRSEDSISANLESNCLLSVSNNGEKFAYSADENFYIKRTDNFMSVNEFPGPSLHSLNKSLARYSLSDNGMLLALDNEGIVYIYNTQNGELIHKDTLTIGGYGLKAVILSPDGTKMVARANEGLNQTVLYSFKPEGWKEAGTATIDPVDFFYSQDGSSIYIAGYTDIQNRKPDDFSLISTYSLPMGYFHSADLERGRFLWDIQTGNTQLLVDLKTGKIIDTLNTGYAGMCRLFDNYIISSYGLQLTLPISE
jgi:hypothetical protein